MVVMAGHMGILIEAWVWWLREEAVRLLSALEHVSLPFYVSNAKWELRMRSLASVPGIWQVPRAIALPRGEKSFLEGTNLRGSNGLGPFKGPQYVNSSTVHLWY